MLAFFRSFSSSKFGLVFVLGFLGLIAFAFASSDVANNTTIGGGAGGEGVASVGKSRVDTSTLGIAATSGLERLKQDNPTLSMKAFVAGGGLEAVLKELIDVMAINEFGKKHGIAVSDRLIDSEIAKIAAFQGPDGKFSDAAFRQALQQRGISDKLFRDDLAQRLISAQVLVPASFATVISKEATLRYAGLLTDQRSGEIALIPAAAFAPRTLPTDAEIQAFYAANRDRYIRPERRTIRFASFGEEALKSIPAPSEAEIASRYKANQAQYAASENRRFTQLIVPTEAAAQAIMAEVSKGLSLDAAASAKGLKAAAIGPLAKTALSSQASLAVAEAAFAAAQGALAAPARSGLGWHILRVDGIERKAERTLDMARGEIAAALTTEKRREAINDLSARLEEEFDSGGNLTDAAKELGLTIQSTPVLTADGKVYGSQDQQGPAAVARILQAAFAMEKEGEPQLAEVEAGKTFMIFDVADITPSAAAPLAEIRQQVAAGAALAKGATGAKAAADKVLAATRKGTALGAALAGAGASLPLPPPQNIQLNRQQLPPPGQQVPPPLALLFSMAQGTTKKLAAPNNAGWFIVTLKQIVPGKIDAADPRLAGAQRELGGLIGREYAEALKNAARAEVGVKRNDAAIKAVRTQLVGTN